MGKLLSMTGYGSAKGSVEGQEITVTVKGFNAMSGYRYKTPAELKAAAKAVEDLQQFADILEMEAGGGLVQYVERLAGGAAAEFLGEFHALRFAAR